MPKSRILGWPRVGEHDVAGLEVAMEDAARVGAVRARRRWRRRSGSRRRAAAGRPRVRASSEPPGTYSMTRKSVPSWVSKSKMVATPGWERRESTCASRRKRSRVSRADAPAGAEQLDGDVAVEVGVAGPPDLAHAAGADAFEELVAAEGRSHNGHLLLLHLRPELGEPVLDVDHFLVRRRRARGS